MFVIKANGEKKLWHNSVKDDFLRFIPMQLGVDKKDLQIWFLRDGLKHRQVELWMQGTAQNQTLDLSVDGILGLAILIKNKDKPDYLDVKEKVELTKLERWPYDSVDNFKKI